MTIEQTPPASYWYSDSSEDERGQRVMEAMRLYRAAEMAMRRRTQDSMSMGENELLVLRYLTRASGRREGVTPVELARYLGVSTASTTALLDRLEKTGHLERRRHPTDRRKVLVQPTAHTEEEMRDTLGTMHGRMMQATRGMTDAEAEAVMGFLHRMRCAVDSVCDQPGAGCCAALAPSSRLRAS